MHAMGRIAVEDHVTPLVDAFNATKPHRHHLYLPPGSDAVRIEQGNGAEGPFIRILPSPILFALMGYAMQERWDVSVGSRNPSVPA